MDGSAERAKLAELLRMGARAGRQVALLRPHGDAIIIERLAEQADAMAAELEALVASAPAGPSESDPRHWRRPCRVHSELVNHSRCIDRQTINHDAPMRTGLESDGFRQAYAVGPRALGGLQTMVQVKTANRTTRRDRRQGVRLRAALAAGAVLVAATSGAAADALRARYSVSLVGLRIGDLYANGTFEPKSYHIDLTAQLTGVAALMSNTRLALASSGSVRKEKITPTSYATSTVNDKETRTLRMGLKSGSVKALEITPPPHFWGERVPVTEANKRNILDPTSALIMPVPAKEPLDGPAACDRTLPIYDGYARFDVALHYAGTREVQVAGYSGPVAVCTARYHPISGHMVNSRSTAFMAQNTGIEVWLGPIEPSHFVVPLKVSLPTMTGQLEVEPVEFSVTSDSPQSTH